MEPLRIRVKSVEMMPKEQLVVARVLATSLRKLNGRPAARIELVVTFRAEGVAGSKLTADAREAALDCLDKIAVLRAK